MATKNLHEQALIDVEELRKVAFENAKNVLVEAIVPKIKEMIEGELGEGPVVELGAPEEDPNGLPPEVEALAGMGIPGMAPPAGMGMGMPSLGQALPSVGEVGMVEVEDEDDMGLPPPQDFDFPEPKKGAKSDKDEDEKEDKEDDGEDKDMDEAKLETEAKDAEKEEMDEVVNITQEDLRKAFQEVLKTELSEATVTKSFGPVSTPDEGGILDKKSGEHHWKDEEAPHAQDWTVKEAKKYVAAAVRANAELKAENTQLRKAYGLLKQNLTEVHLFNSKLLHAQKLIRKAGLSGAKSSAVIEAFDRAQSVREVELIYKSLSESLTKIAGVVTEAKDLKGPKASRTVKPSATLIQEGADNEGNEQFARWGLLAGIQNAVK